MAVQISNGQVGVRQSPSIPATWTRDGDVTSQRRGGYRHDVPALAAAPHVIRPSAE